MENNSGVDVNIDLVKLMKENEEMKKEIERMKRYIDNLECSVRYLTAQVAKNC